MKVREVETRSSGIHTSITQVLRRYIPAGARLNIHSSQMGADSIKSYKVPSSIP